MSEEEKLRRALEAGAVEKTEDCCNYQNGKEEEEEKSDGGEVCDPPENGDLGANDKEVRRVAALLARGAPKFFPELCDRCIRAVQQRLSSLSLSGELSACLGQESSVGNEDYVAANSLTSPFNVGGNGKRSWGEEEQSSSSEIDEERPPIEENQASESESSSPAAAPVTEIGDFTGKESNDLSERGRSFSFHNEKVDFAWKNVLLPSPRTPGRTADPRQTPGERAAVINGPPSPWSYGETDEDGPNVGDGEVTSKLSREDRENFRYVQVERKKDFVCMERVRGRLVNIAEGLELHKKIFSKKEQQRLVDLIYGYRQKGRDGLLRGRTYSEPRKWMRGKGRVTIQFGCCYNYAVDKNGNPPGIMHEELVDPLPSDLKASIRRLVKWHVLPETCVPDSCIVNIYDEGDCIPPHIDHHDFERPFCTLSLLSECSIVFGASLSIVGPGDFDGPLSIPLPVGSVLVLKGNGADIAKHAVPAVPTSRISITFRKMDPSRVPRGYEFPEDLKRIKPLPNP